MLDVPEIPTPSPTKPTFKEQVHEFFFPKKNQSATKLPDVVTKKLEIISETKDDPVETGFGRTFQNNLSNLSDSELPPIIESEGQLGIVETNEMLSYDTAMKIKNDQNAPNGYIFGAGFGNIVSMTLLYPEGTVPKAICAVDVIPDVVVAGRIIEKMTANNTSFSDFKENLVNSESIDSLFEEVISEEINSTVKSRFQAVDKNEIKKQFKSIKDKSNVGSQSYTEMLIPNDSTRIDVLAVIQKQYELLHRMAVDGNIGIAYADITSPAVLEKIKSLPEFAEKRNIIYLSNIIDHLTRRGTNLDRINSFDVLKILGEEKNWFVDTTQNSLDYQLRVSNHVPKYTSDDVRMRFK